MISCDQSSKMLIKNKFHKLLMKKHKEIAFLVRHGYKLAIVPMSNVEINKEFKKEINLKKF